MHTSARYTKLSQQESTPEMRGKDSTSENGRLDQPYRHAIHAKKEQAHERCVTTQAKQQNVQVHQHRLAPQCARLQASVQALDQHTHRTCLTAIPIFCEVIRPCPPRLMCVRFRTTTSSPLPTSSMLTCMHNPVLLTRCFGYTCDLTASG